MTSQFYGLNIAYSGLLASNAALNTTANNISNAETDGYSRQKVTQTAASALRTYTSFGCMGAGVDVSDVERIRDSFYDDKFWDNNKYLGEYEKKEYYMNQIQDYFVDDDSIKGFTTIFNEMYNGLQELQKSAGDTTVKSQFVGFANNLCEYFNEMSSNLGKIQEDLNEEIKVAVSDINSIAEEIASLNKQINVIEITGVTANELRDQRTLLVDRLSKLVGVEAYETPIVDANNPDRKTGANRFRVVIAGQTLVDTDEFKTLECVARDSFNSANQSDIQGLYDIKWSDGSDFGMYNALMGGELQGLIQMRDGNNGEYFNGAITAVTAPDASGIATVSVEVTADYLTDLNKLSMNNQGMISLGNRMFMFDSWEFDKTTNTYTFTIDTTNAVNTGRDITAVTTGKKAEVNTGIEYQGIPYYQAQLNEWARSFSKSFNEILTTNGAVDEEGRPGINLFTADLANATEATFTDESSNVVSSSSDIYRNITAGNFSVSTVIENDSDRLATHTGEFEGQDKNDVVAQLIRMRSDKDMMSFRGGSAQEFLQTILGDVALNTERAEIFRGSGEKKALSIENQRQSISGVDNDEEAVNLVKFQNAYNLSSKVIQVLTEIYDRLILQTGV